MKVKSLKLRDVKYGNQWAEEIEDHWNYEDFKSNPAWRQGWISFDSAFYNAEDDRVYLGITSFDADIFRAYDRNSREFLDLGYSRIADPYDAKFHRSLVKYEADGCLYGAIALLHDSDRQWEAPGGAIIRYDPKTGALERRATPLPHVYIQAIAIDQQRGFLYCQCFPPEYLIRYDLNSGEVKNLGLIGTGIAGMAQGENVVLDDDGNLWGPWCITRAWQNQPGPDANRIFRVPAGGENIEFLKTGLPKRDSSYGYEKMESLFNLGDGHMYASGANGSLYHIDRETGQATYLFTPVADRRSRLTSLVLGLDGCAYGVTGRDGKCEFLRFDFKNTKYDLLGPVVDEQGEPCWQVHDICIANDGTFYACENDNPHRSSYLWEITL